jgi:hypothetical protein
MPPLTQKEATGCNGVTTGLGVAGYSERIVRTYRFGISKRHSFRSSGRSRKSLGLN